ncbi:MAG: hypothetical protein VW918_05285, partial [Alphaproteobacteria bacterium]
KFRGQITVFIQHLLARKRHPPSVTRSLTGSNFWFSGSGKGNSTPPAVVVPFFGQAFTLSA